MRIKYGEYITEIDQVWIRKNDIEINFQFYQTGNQTDKIAKQLLEKGYADLSSFKRI